MTTSGDESLNDDEMDTTAGGTDAVPAGDADGTDGSAGTRTAPTATPRTAPMVTRPTLTAPMVAPATDGEVHRQHRRWQHPRSSRRPPFRSHGD